MTDLQKSVDLLTLHRAAFVFGDEILVSDERGVRFLLSLAKSGRDFSSFSASDRIVGKASAFLYVFLGVKTLFASVVSRSAKEYLEQSGVMLSYGEITDVILSDDGINQCPMEIAVSSSATPSEAILAIENKLLSFAK